MAPEPTLKVKLVAAEPCTVLLLPETSSASVLSSAVFKSMVMVPFTAAFDEVRVNDCGVVRSAPVNAELLIAALNCCPGAEAEIE